MPSIFIEKGPERGQNAELADGRTFVFGRDKGCDLVTSDKACSRRHFQIEPRDGTWFVRDLESTHGTLLNGAHLDVSEIKDGDTITVGETTLSFSAPRPGSEGAAGPGLAGKTIAGYQLIGRIGRGGMGTVYRAKQIALDREVALKVLSAKYSGDKVFINRFFREAQAAARLNHPHVVQVYDVREEKGLYLISLEIMDGGTVQDIATKEGQLPVPRVLDIARDAAAGLVYAEKKGIVHGDIKPDNLMMNTDGIVKISDLGLARDAGEVAHQGEGGIFGTPHFISPEQAQGKPVDSRSDIYSLGATLYRLLAGVTPFSGSSVKEIILKQINDEPRPLRELRADCPQDLADLVSVMMAKAPDDRFESAQALLEAIEALGSSGTLGSGKSSRSRLFAVLGVALLILAGAGFFVASRLGKDEPDDGPKPGPASGGPQLPNAGDPTEAIRLKTERELAVTLKIGEARRRELEITQQGKSDDPATLSEIAALYRAAVAEGPDTDAAKGASEALKGLEERISDIQSRIAAEEAERERLRAAADAAFAALSTKVESALTEHRFADALAEAEAGQTAIAGSHREAEGRDLAQRVIREATKSSDADELAVNELLERHDFSAARKRLTDKATAAESRKGEGEPWTILANIASAARRRIGEIDALEAAKLESDLKADRTALVEGLKKYWTGAAAFSDCAARTAAVAAIEGSQSTPTYAGEVDQLRRRNEAMVRLLDDLKARAASSDSRPAVSSAAKSLPTGTIVSADDKGLVVERRNGKQESKAWADLDAESLVRGVLRKMVDGPRQKMDLAMLCLEAGLNEDAVQILAEIGESPTDDIAAELAGLRTRAERERQAESLLTEIRGHWTAAKSGNDANAWFRLEQEISRFLKNFKGTRTFILASDGSTPWVDAAPK